MKCPRCQHDNPQGARFCEECATPLARSCSNCGTALSGTAKFCHACAHPVAAAAGTPSRTPDSYTPKHLAEKILTSKAALEGERKQMTVLFADLKGSNALRGYRCGGRATCRRGGRRSRPSPHQGDALHRRRCAASAATVAGISGTAIAVWGSMTRSRTRSPSSGSTSPWASGRMASASGEPSRGTRIRRWVRCLGPAVAGGVTRGRVSRSCLPFQCASVLWGTASRPMWPTRSPPFAYVVLVASVLLGGTPSCAC
jgi:hypothetical protein